MPLTEQNNPADHDAWQAAADYGVDMSLIRHRLSLTPTQRLQLHMRALRRIRRLRRAKPVK